MEFALTLEVSEIILKKGISDYIHEISDYISEFLKVKNYGNGLKTFYVGIICVSAEFDFFFNIRQPKFCKTNTIVQDDRPYKVVNYLTYDIKLNFEDFLNANEIEVKKMLSLELLSSFEVLNSLEIKNFQKEKFENDIAQHLKVYILE